MKSYYTHLKSTMEFGEENSITRKPILRSSGVFPVVQNKNYSIQSAFFDYDLDGDLDMYLLNHPVPGFKAKKVLNSWIAGTYSSLAYSVLPCSKWVIASVYSFVF